MRNTSDLHLQLKPVNSATQHILLLIKRVLDCRRKGEKKIINPVARWDWIEEISGGGHQSSHGGPRKEEAPTLYARAPPVRGYHSFITLLNERTYGEEGVGERFRIEHTTSAIQVASSAATQVRYGPASISLLLLLFLDWKRKRKRNACVCARFTCDKVMRKIAYTVS